MRPTYSSSDYDFFVVLPIDLMLLILDLSGIVIHEGPKKVDVFVQEVGVGCGSALIYDLPAHA